MNIFMREFRETLEGYIGILVPEGIYMDLDRLKPGYNFSKALATAICRSACMIVVYTPLYQEKPYCIQEFRAMQLLAEQRMPILRKNDLPSKNLSMIIPIVLRGDFQDLPTKIKEIQYFDFSQFYFTTGRLLRSAKYRNMFQDIAKTIYRHCMDSKELERRGFSQDCNSFVFPSEEEAVKSWGPRTRVRSTFPGHL